ncbi:hypothetical protein QR680_001041 [Steinernema hermaphroditum]|uniref:Uncharacterized protein n=1 Tax=Steinernema hermaphroditum TaxID=289476 RepID=A0AA39GWS4_9BILA|nr:hypothetical protein QR680_001041 [Steinernema hermaphroditum]
MNSSLQSTPCDSGIWWKIGQCFISAGGIVGSTSAAITFVFIKNYKDIHPNQKILTLEFLAYLVAQGVLLSANEIEIFLTVPDCNEVSKQPFNLCLRHRLLPLIALVPAAICLLLIMLERVYALYHFFYDWEPHKKLVRYSISLLLLLLTAELLFVFWPHNNNDILCTWDGLTKGNVDAIAAIQLVWWATISVHLVSAVVLQAVTVRRIRMLGSISPVVRRDRIDRVRSMLYPRAIAILFSTCSIMICVANLYTHAAIWELIAKFFHVALLVMIPAIIVLAHRKAIKKSDFSVRVFFTFNSGWLARNDNQQWMMKPFQRKTPFRFTLGIL